MPHYPFSSVTRWSCSPPPPLANYLLSVGLVSDDDDDGDGQSLSSRLNVDEEIMHDC